MIHIMININKQSNIIPINDEIINNKNFIQNLINDYNINLDDCKKILNNVEQLIKNSYKSSDDNISIDNAEFSKLDDHDISNNNYDLLHIVNIGKNILKNKKCILTIIYNKQNVQIYYLYYKSIDNDYDILYIVKNNNVSIYRILNFEI